MTNYFDFTLSADRGRPEVWQACYVKPSGRMHGSKVNPRFSAGRKAVYALCAGLYRVRYDNGAAAWLAVCDLDDGGHTVRKISDAQAYRVMAYVSPPDPYAYPLSIESALAISL